MLDVLEHVQAEDRVDVGVVFDGDRFGEIEALDLHVAILTEEMPQDPRYLSSMSVAMTRSHRSRNRVMLPTPEPTSRNATTDEPLDLFPHPSVVTRDLLHAPARCGTGMLVLCVVDRGIAEDRRHRGDTVLPADLLFLPVVASVIGDWHLVTRNPKRAIFDVISGSDAEAVERSRKLFATSRSSSCSKVSMSVRFRSVWVGERGASD